MDCKYYIVYIYCLIGAGVIFDCPSGKSLYSLVLVGRSYRDDRNNIAESVMTRCYQFNLQPSLSGLFSLAVFEV